MPNPWAAGHAMLASAKYVRKHLGEVAISDEHRALVAALCSQWETLFFDLIDDGLSAALAERWTDEVLGEQHRVVMALDAAARSDATRSGAYLLVSESAANVLNAYGSGPEAPSRKP